MSIDRLAAKIAALPLNARGRRSYPLALRREVMASLATSGMTRKDFAAKVGLPGPNLSNWRKFAPKARPKRVPERFRALAVEPEGSPEMLSLRAPGGVVVEGLTVATAVELIAALAGRPAC